MKRLALAFLVVVLPSCRGADRCASDNGGCDARVSCSETNGSVSCGACPDGYVGDGASCTDLDECSGTPRACDPRATCTNTEGSFTCGACPAGFTGDGTRCLDVDECAALVSPCDVRTTCTNTPGDFTCSDCPMGFSGSGKTACVDVDECATNNGGCSALVTCTNTAGGFTCGGCPAGYVSPSPGQCVDVDECATPGACDARTTCTNTTGGFECSACPAGFAGTGKTSCVDIDECLDAASCDPLTTCTNSVGSFSCGACPSGYGGTGATRCVDVDECLDPGACDARTSCTNTPGSYACGPCPSGFSGTGMTSCMDVNECATNNGGCSTLVTCTNTPGSFTCGSCPAGYSSPQPGRCDDIDECLSATACDPRTTCTNTAGSYTCSACPAGYTGTGRSGCVVIPSVVTVTATDGALAEPADGATVRIDRGQARVGAITVRLARQASSTARLVAGGVFPADVTSNVGTLTANELSVTIADGATFVTVVLTPLDNVHAEAQETLSLVAQPGAGYTLGSAITADLTIAATGGQVLHALDSATSYAQLEGSVRQGFLNLNSGVTASVQSTAALSVNLVEGLPLLTRSNVVVENTGTGLLTLNGNDTFRILENRGAGVTFRKLHLRRGSDPNLGGAILNRGGLVLTGCTVSENSAPRGAALMSFAAGGMPTLELNGGSVVRDNVTGTAVENGGGALIISNTSFTNNAQGNVVGGYTNGGGNSPATP